MSQETIYDESPGLQEVSWEDVQGDAQANGYATPASANAQATDFITILESDTDQILAKTRTPEGCTTNSKAATFDIRTEVISSLTELASILDKLNRYEAPICGQLRPEYIGKSHGIRRRLHSYAGEPATLQEAEHRWLLVDIDTLPCPEEIDLLTQPELAAKFVISQLPEEFHGAGHWWQLTASAGFKPGIRMRLAFWLDRALTGQDIKQWLAKVKCLDHSIYTANQLIYAAWPIFEKGVKDPVPRGKRSGLVQGKVVSPPERRPALDNTKPAETWGTPQRSLNSYRGWRAAIGDHPEGQGFFEPIKSAIGAWVRANPIADTAWLREDLERAIHAAKRDRSLHEDAYIEARVRDLDSAIAAIVERERKKPAPQWVTALNERYAVVRFRSKLMVAVTDEPEIVFLSKDAFFDMHANKFPPTLDEEESVRKSQGRAWFAHRHRRECLSPGVIFKPRASSASPIDHPGALNLWRGYAVEPQPGDWSLMQAHILHILANGNAEHAAYILDWMAYTVQHPDIPTEVALAFTGHQGSGKGVVWIFFGSLFAPHFRHFSHPDQFTGKFNANLGKSVFVFLDEAIWGGDKKVEGKIKSTITEKTLQIEPKGIDSWEEPNRLSIVACSNELWSVPIGMGDRRWAAFRASDHYAFQDCAPTEREAYFGPLYKQMEQGGRAAMLHDLLARKVTAAQIRDVPNTAEKARLKSRALDPVERWLEACLQDGEAQVRVETYENNRFVSASWQEDGFEIEKDPLYDGYQKFCRDFHQRPEVKNVWARKLSTTLKEAFNPEFRENLSGNRRGPRKFRFGPLSRCRVEFDKAVGNVPGGEHWAALPSAAREKENKKGEIVRLVHQDNGSVRDRDDFRPASRPGSFPT
jgi:hypothetical protein